MVEYTPDLNIKEAFSNSFIFSIKWRVEYACKFVLTAACDEWKTLSLRNIFFCDLVKLSKPFTFDANNAFEIPYPIPYAIAPFVALATTSSTVCIFPFKVSVNKLPAAPKAIVPIQSGDGSLIDYAFWMT